MEDIRKIRTIGWSVILAVSLFLYLALGCNKRQQEIYIRINQAGYLPGEKIKAVVFSRAPVMGNFSLGKVTGGEISAEARPVQIRTKTWGAFSYYYELDFSHVSDTGRFCIMGSGTGVTSAEFIISPEAYGS
ncbi:MAG: hypothetical protein E4G95_09470, partial [Bacteroidia bacterium]